MNDFVIRPYQPMDRTKLHQIGADTAYFGEPIEAYLDDRQLFLDAFYSYYTDIEPGSCRVVCYQDNVIGFLTGCVDTRNYQKLVKKIIIPKVMLGIIGVKYHLGKRTISYSRGLFSEYINRDEHPTDLETYPAHLHINIEANWRGNGLGRKLIQSFLDQLVALKICGVHLHTTDRNLIACLLYEKMGFGIIQTHSNRFWSKWFGTNVEDRCYGKKLT
jgi:hypothetical protein